MRPQQGWARRSLLLFAVMAAPAPVAAQSSDATRPTPRARITSGDGLTLYRTICQGCHMAAGEGAVGAGDYPALATNPKLAAAPYVTMMVLDGRGGMPGFDDLLDDRQVAEIVRYVRISFGNDYADPVSAEEVRNMRH